MAQCFYCKEEINAMALKCPHCRSDFLPAYTGPNRGRNSDSGWRSPQPASDHDFDGFWLTVAVIGVAYGIYQLVEWLNL